MTRPLEGRVAVITGSSRGIGKAIAKRLGAAGAAVMISSRKAESLAAAADELRDAGVRHVEWYVANAGEPDHADGCLAATVERLGRVDILVNNAGTNPYFGPLMKMDVARADKTARVNLFSVVAWTQAAWRAGFETDGGVVVNIASVGGMAVDPTIGYYNATKAGVIHLTRQLAAELAPTVRVNAIAPGLVKTDMARALWEAHEPELAAATPLRRLGDPDDIAEVVLFLASDSAGWITGQTVTVDGGQLVRPTS